MLVDRSLESYMDLAPEMRRLLLEYMGKHLTDDRRQLIDQKLEDRTRFLTVALEDLYHPHNASAILRTVEIFGLQDMHVVQNEKWYRPNRAIVKGAYKWVDINRYKGSAEEPATLSTIDSLKAKGYQIAVTSLRDGCVSLDDFVPTQPTCVVFGTEETGVSDEVHDAADVYLQIPMFGFTQSFNVSVTCAMILRDLTSKIRQHNMPWQLSELEKEELRFDWYCKTLPCYEDLLKRFFVELEATKKRL